MKKIKSLTVTLLAVVLVFSSCIMAFADTTPATVSLFAYQTTVKAGDEVTVTVSLSSSPMFGSIGFMFDYDKNVLEFVDYEFTIDTAINNYDKSEDFAYCLLWKDAVLNGEILRVVYRVKENAPVGDITIGLSRALIKNGASNITVNPVEAIKLTVPCDHQYGEWTNVNENNHSRTCPVCGNVEAAAHTWNDGEVTKATTCTEEGVTTYTCTACGATKGETIAKAKTAHSWNSGVVTKKATCAEYGEMTYTCTLCEETKVEAIAKASHKFGETVTIEPSYSGGGYSEHICEICGYSEKFDFAAPPAPKAEEITASKVVLIKVQGYEYSKDGEVWQSENVFRGLKANTEYCFYQRVAESDTTSVSEKSQAFVVRTPQKANCKNKAITPIVTEQTSNSVTLMNIEGYEYSKDGINWTDNCKFTGLVSDHSYTLYQRIKETDSELASAASSLTVKTDKIGVSTNTYFDKLRSYITTYGAIEAQDDNFSYKISNQDSGIKFEVVDSNMNEILAGKTERYEFRKLDFVLCKGVKDISINGVSNWPPTNCKTVADRTTYTVGKTYKFDSFSALDDLTVNTLYSKLLDLLCLKSEQVIFVKLGFGLCELGFTHFVGVGNPACDPVSGYHTGKTELRYQRNALCTIDGYTGDTYCASCGVKIKTGTVIPSAGQHTYDNQCDESCNVCGYLRDVEHTYSGACDPSCNICGHIRKTTVAHTYGSDEDDVCKVCGAKQILGDLNGDEKVTKADVIYLLNYTLAPNSYPIGNAFADFTHDGVVNKADVIYLLNYTLAPSAYPLTK